MEQRLCGVCRAGAVFGGGAMMIEILETCEKDLGDVQRLWADGDGGVSGGVAAEQ